MAKTFVVHPDYDSLKAELQHALSRFSENENFVTKGERNVIKKVTIAGVDFNIKKFKTPNLFQGLVYRFLRKSKAKRSFEYAEKLITFDINTPFPVAYAETFSGGLKQSFYISKHIVYDLDFRVLNHNPKFPNRAEILRQVAAFTFELHEKNVNFKDHSPGNTLIVDKGDGNYIFYLIDLNRMRFEPLSFEKRMHNFRRLWLSKTMINIMAAKYATLYGKSVEETHALMTKHSRAFQRKVNFKKLLRRRKN